MPSMKKKHKSILSFIIGLFFILISISIFSTVINSLLKHGGGLMILLTIPAMILLLIAIFFTLLGFYYILEISPKKKKKGLFLVTFGIILLIWPSLINILIYWVFSYLVSGVILFDFFTILRLISSTLFGVILSSVFILPGLKELKSAKDLPEPILDKSIETSAAGSPGDSLKKLTERKKIIGLVLIVIGLVMLLDSLYSIYFNFFSAISLKHEIELGWAILFYYSPLLFSLTIFLAGAVIYHSIGKYYLVGLSFFLGTSLMILTIIGMIDMYNLIKQGRYSEYYLTPLNQKFFYIIIGILLILNAIYQLVNKNKKKPE